MKAALLMALLVLFNTASARAATAVADRYSTHTYVGTILSVEGNHNSAFPIGARVVVTTTLDRDATDIVSVPMFGHYAEGAISVTIELPDSGFSTRHGPGILSLANNQEDGASVWDHFQVYANTLDAGSGYVDGYVVNTGMFELWQILPLGGSPTMLESDAIPTRPLAGANFAAFEIWTSIGYAYVRVQLAPFQPTVRELAHDAKARIHELVTAGRMNQGIAASLVAKLEAILQAHDRSSSACGQLAGLRNQVGHLPRRTPLETDVFDELNAIVAELGEAMPECRSQPDP